MEPPHLFRPSRRTASEGRSVLVDFALPVLLWNASLNSEYVEERNRDGGTICWSTGERVLECVDLVQGVCRNVLAIDVREICHVERSKW